jgi:hypothetical protein
MHLFWMNGIDKAYVAQSPGGRLDEAAGSLVADWLD